VIVWNLIPSPHCANGCSSASGPENSFQVLKKVRVKSFNIDGMRNFHADGLRSRSESELNSKRGRTTKRDLLRESS
jgi:hypothetical protein